MINSEKLIAVPDVAKLLKVTPQYVRKLIGEEKLMATRIGNQWIVKCEDLEKYLREYDVSIEPDDHEREGDELPNIVALSFFTFSKNYYLNFSIYLDRRGMTCYNVKKEYERK